MEYDSGEEAALQGGAALPIAADDDQVVVEATQHTQLAGSTPSTTLDAAEDIQDAAGASIGGDTELEDEDAAGRATPCRVLRPRTPITAIPQQQRASRTAPSRVSSMSKQAKRAAPPKSKKFKKAKAPGRRKKVSSGATPPPSTQRSVSTQITVINSSPSARGNTRQPRKRSYTSLNETSTPASTQARKRLSP